MGGLGDIMNVLMGLLPSWATDTVTALLAVSVGLGALYWSQMRRIRGTVRRMVKASPEEQERLTAQALKLAGTRPGLLILLEHEAYRRHQNTLAEAALLALKATGKRPQDVARVQMGRKPARAPVGHPTEVAVQVASLLDQGMLEAASSRLGDGLKRWPDHPELLELRERTRASHSAPPIG